MSTYDPCIQAHIHGCVPTHGNKMYIHIHTTHTHIQNQEMYINCRHYARLHHFSNLSGVIHLVTFEPREVVSYDCII